MGYRSVRSSWGRDATDKLETAVSSNLFVITFYGTPDKEVLRQGYNDSKRCFHA